ncbi:hypothetical protein WN51_08369 [Melipona quadrifasciata]|uniref:Uncharacterized protein n=1 Tax=Melipona quadrifasciata TaxID=166423 RepID=A0A0N0BK81_9HYME|nr:hypothetical protein WN51_08369 [Melipona quadrifasciata]
MNDDLTITVIMRLYCQINTRDTLILRLFVEIKWHSIGNNHPVQMLDIGDGIDKYKEQRKAENFTVLSFEKITSLISCISSIDKASDNMSHVRVSNVSDTSEECINNGSLEKSRQWSATNEYITDEKIDSVIEYEPYRDKSVIFIRKKSSLGCQMSQTKQYQIESLDSGEKRNGNEEEAFHGFSEYRTRYSELIEKVVAKARRKGDKYKKREEGWDNLKT